MSEDLSLTRIAELLDEADAEVVWKSELRDVDSAPLLVLPEGTDLDTRDRILVGLSTTPFASLEIVVIGQVSEESNNESRDEDALIQSDSEELSDADRDEEREVHDAFSSAQNEAIPAVDEESVAETSVIEQPVVWRSPVEQTAHSAVEDVNAKLKELRLRRRELDMELRVALMEARRDSRAADRLDEQLEGLQLSRDSLEQWVGQRRHSFAWQFIKNLGSERQRAYRDENEARNTLNSGRAALDRLLVPEYSKPRFVPKALISLALVLGIVIGVQLLVDRSGAFGEAYVPGFWPMLGFALIVYASIFISLWLSAERARASKAISEAYEARKESGNHGLDMGQHALMLIVLTRRVIAPIPLLVAGVFAIQYLKRVLPLVISQWIPEAMWLWIGAGILWLVIVGVAWYRYSTELSVLRGHLLRAMYAAEMAQKKYAHAVREGARLDAMHAMVPEYLELLARVMHRPWIVDTSLVDAGRVDVPSDAFPASVSLSAATRDAGRAGNLLHQRAMSIAYQPGWLSAAFEDLLEVVADSEVTTGLRIDFEAVAADPGDSRYGPRQRVLQAIQKDQVLAAVGRDRLPVLADAIQRHGIRMVRPLVRPLRGSGIDGIQVSSSRFLHEHKGHVGWNEFMLVAVAPASPFSLLAFDDDHLSARPTRVHSSHAMVPAQLVSEVNVAGIDVIPEVETAGSPLDIVVRIDRSDWIDPRMLKIFSGTSEFHPTEELPSSVEAVVLPED